MQELDKEIGELKRDEVKRLQSVRALEGQRDRVARMATEKAVKLREAHETISIKQQTIEVGLSYLVYFPL